MEIEDLLQKAFSKASEAADKEKLLGLQPMAKAKIKEKVRLKVASGHILRSLIRLHASIPAESEITPFYQDLLKALGAEGLGESRREIGTAIRKIRKLGKQSLSKMDRAKTPASLHAIRKAAYGRISSEARTLMPTVAYLAQLGPRLKELPTIRSDLPTVVIAGYPNVGKTTLLKSLTGSDPEIRPIPFTTQRIQVGYCQFGWTTLQVIDTPGLLDRPLAERNPVEMKAVGALKHLANMTVFIIDPTTRSGFVLDDQLGLLAEVRGSFPVPPVVVINKIDIATEHEMETARASLPKGVEAIEISCSSQKGLGNLRERISSYLIDHIDHLEG